jgi:hypothetical protein
MTLIIVFRLIVMILLMLLLLMLELFRTSSSLCRYVMCMRRLEDEMNSLLETKKQNERKSRHELCERKLSVV